MEKLVSEPVQALVAINVLLTLSLLLPFVCGVWSLGMPGFMAVGAYTASWLSLEWHWSTALALLVGTVAGAVATFPFAVLALRIREIHLAIATLAAAELIGLFFAHFQPTGGVMGLTGMPYLGARWIMVIAALAVIACSWLYNSRLGKALIAVGSDATVAACHGLNVPSLQFIALALSGGLAGLAGGCFAYYYTFISPPNFGFTRTVDILMFLVVGGLTPLGTVTGATLLTLMPQIFAGLERWAPAIYGLIVLLMAAYVPDGIFPKNRMARLVRAIRPEPRSSIVDVGLAPTAEGDRAQS